jgi:hypothetical protein
MRWKTAVAILGAVVGCASLSVADPAIDMTGLTLEINAHLNPFYDISTGWQFTPKETLVVTRVGCYSLYDTLAHDHIIRIYDDAGGVVVSETVLEGSVIREDGGYAYVDVSNQNIPLEADRPYVIASYWQRTSSSWDYDIFAPPPGME